MRVALVLIFLLALAPAAHASGSVKEAGAFTGKQVATEPVTFDGKNIGTVSCTQSAITGAFANANNGVIDMTITALTFANCKESITGSACTVTVIPDPKTGVLVPTFEGHVEDPGEDNTGLNRTGTFRYKNFGFKAVIKIDCQAAVAKFTCFIELHTSLLVSGYDGGATNATTNTNGSGHLKFANYSALTAVGCPTNTVKMDADWELDTTANATDTTLNIEAGKVMGNAGNAKLAYGTIVVTCGGSAIDGTVDGTTIDYTQTFSSCTASLGGVVTITCSGTVTFTFVTSGGGSGTGTVDLDSGHSCTMASPICTVDVKGPQNPTSDDPFAAGADTLDLNVTMNATRTGSVFCGPASGTVTLTATYSITPTTFTVGT